MDCDLCAWRDVDEIENIRGDDAEDEIDDERE